MRRIAALAKITDEPGGITRTFASPGMQRANGLVAEWMREAGMVTRLDAMGNLIGRLDSPAPRARTLLLGSHLDTVRDAGRFDGPLGVLLGIAAAAHCNRQTIRPGFAVEVVGFCDEEGVRYQTTYLGSKAMAGGLEPRDFQRQDAAGVRLAEALKALGGSAGRWKTARRDPRALLGYVEAHIEQGPVLEKNHLAVGVVTGIAGQTRARVVFTGQAGHAGTVPMNLRRDALCAAAEWVLAVEQAARAVTGLVATTGQITALPGASNVIPGEARLTLDVRHAEDRIRNTAQKKLEGLARAIARRRKIRVQIERVHTAAAAACCPDLSARLGRAVARHQRKVLPLPSGAGHDAAMLARITPVAMLFIRCRGGISHHPDESVRTADVRVALAVLNDFIAGLAKDYERV